jgi:hypothetical protein
MAATKANGEIVAVALPPMQSPQLMNQPNEEAAANDSLPLWLFAPAAADSEMRVESTMTPKLSPPGPAVSELSYCQLNEYVPGTFVVTWSWHGPSVWKNPPEQPGANPAGLCELLPVITS